MEFYVLKTNTHMPTLCAAILCGVILLSSCEKEIEIDLPASEREVVIEGRIEAGEPPVVFVSQTRGFFEPTTFEDFVNSFIDDAEVTVNGIALDRICLDEVPPELVPIFEEATGLIFENATDLPLCGYIGLDPDLLGQENTTYRLEVQAAGKTLRSAAHIPHAFPPDSVWFRLWANSPLYGYAFAHITDPDTLNNAYRVFTRRIGPNQNSNPVDPTFYAPLGASFADDFFNGETIEVVFLRGQPPNSSRPVDMGESARFFEIGDRFVFKFCSTTRPVYDFFRTYEAQIGSNGSPFAAPNNVISNVEGGLGVWAAYACTYDTLLAVP